MDVYPKRVTVTTRSNATLASRIDQGAIRQPLVTRGGESSMVSLHLPSCLNQNPKEQQVIGNLVIQYGELEYMLCRVVGLIIEDEDVAVKTMYRVRGETNRLDIARALVSSRIQSSSVKEPFLDTFSGMKVCMKIRNAYAHAHWISASGDEIGFYDLEGIAKSDRDLRFDKMKKSLLDMRILADQDRFFAEVLHNLIYMFYELNSIHSNPANFSKIIFPLKIPRLAVPTQRQT